VPPPNRPKKRKSQVLGPSDSLLSPPAASDPHFFDFDLDRGIREQVVGKLEASPILPLEKNVGPALSGIYALYYRGDLVYIGKASKGTTKSKRTLRDRLNEHVAKLGRRENLALENLQCRYLTFVSEWWVFAAEFALMVHYAPAWNASGIGSKTPGKGRPGTERISRFDKLFPPKIT
jgi:Eco29kI restriction endonuclease